MTTQPRSAPARDAPPVAGEGGLASLIRALAVVVWRAGGGLVTVVRQRLPGPGRGGWESSAQERYLRAAGDAHDLERRQRAWDREESTAYSLSGWR